MLQEHAYAEPRSEPAGVLGRALQDRVCFAAVDLGTNNCRLLIARPEGRTFRVVDAFSRIVRLGEGLNASGVLSDAAMERTLPALAVCRNKIERRGAAVVRAVATEACRRAGNGPDFLDRAERETGLHLEIISSEEEARLAILGCSALFDARFAYALVFDIGGGSTELIWLRLRRGAPPESIGQISIPNGVTTLWERYGADPVAPGIFASMVEELATAIGRFAEAHAIGETVAAGRAQLIGTSGTVTTLAALNMGLARYERTVVDGSVLPIAHARAVIARLRQMDYRQRVAIPCIGPDRADLILAGCAILEAICAVLPFARVSIADRGLREGILLDLMDRRPPWQ